MHSHSDAVLEGELRLQWYVADKSHTLQLALDAATTLPATVRPDTDTQTEDARTTEVAVTPLELDASHAGVVIALPHADPGQARRPALRTSLPLITLL